ncbi:serine/threonine-protein phosphatase 6 regulatory ankyrin repeat subunit C-like [Physella acuta]|uniref:serine/threonine-protein phosphatase 6 regulatory ankyrin repeat subunit C-like n=1 Tax=Physella acuta TaxID=109671 RepID=UPI0027DD7013|nr:serine/threonine-protein phosphatase 6 regulatory ankyrin repeat subunit C-like [Physella acuta]
MPLTELHASISENHAERVLHLIQSGADVNQLLRQETAFTRAVEEKRFDCADVIISSENFDPVVGNQFSRSPIFVAAKQGRTDYVEKLIGLGGDLNAPDIKGLTPLHISAIYNTHTTAELLIQNGAKIDSVDASGLTPLLHACTNVSLETVQVLIANHCNVQALSKDLCSALMLSLPTYYNIQVAGKKLTTMLSICELVLAAGCDVNCQDDKGWSALHHAVNNTDIYGCTLLAERNCFLDLKDKAGRTPLQLSISDGRPKYDIARFLLYFGARVDSSTYSTHLLQYVTEPEHTDERSSKMLFCHLLYEAVPPSMLTTRDAIRPSGDNVPPMNTDKTCPSSLQHHVKTVIRRHLSGTNIIPKIRTLPIANNLKRFLNLGLNADNISLYGLCRLHMAITEFDNVNVKAIVESGTDLDLYIDGKLPLATAIDVGNLEAVKILFAMRPSTSLLNINTQGDTALHLAARLGVTEILDAVIERTDSIDVLDRAGRSPLQVAVLSGRFQNVISLLRRGAKIWDFEGDAPMMHLAAGSGASDVVGEFIKRNIDPNLRDTNGNTPLHIAASRGGEYLKEGTEMPALYDHKALASLDFVKCTLTGQNPSLTKSNLDYVGVVNRLLEAGADVDMLNYNGHTPMKMAQTYKSDAIVDLFKLSHLK